MDSMLSLMVIYMELMCPYIVSSYTVHKPFSIPMSSMLSLMVIYMELMCPYIVPSNTVHRPFGFPMSSIVLGLSYDCHIWRSLDCFEIVGKMTLLSTC